MPDPETVARTLPDRVWLLFDFGVMHRKMPLWHKLVKSIMPLWHFPKETAVPQQAETLEPICYDGRMSTDSPIRSANRLCEIRKKKKKTQEDVAADLGISQSTVGRHERGDRNLTLAQLYDYADYYGVHWSELLADVAQSTAQPNPAFVSRLMVVIDEVAAKAVNEAAAGMPVRPEDIGECIMLVLGLKPGSIDDAERDALRQRSQGATAAYLVRRDRQTSS